MDSNQFEWILSLMICFFVFTSLFIGILIMELSDTQKDIKVIKEKLFENNG